MGGSADESKVQSKAAPKARKKPSARTKQSNEGRKSLEGPEESDRRGKLRKSSLEKSALPGSKERLKPRTQNSKDPGQKQKKAVKKPRDKMMEGELCKSNAFIWKVIKILGSGGFGDVYKVVKENDEDKNRFEEYAMKTEMVIGEKRMLRLKIEVAALLMCKQSKDPKKHFVELIDRGKTEKFKFVVMILVGSSLEDYRKSNNCDFTIPTAMQVAIQTLEAIRDLHKVGWLHRDIKPQNFAHGLGENEATVYVLDFGIAKKIFDKSQNVKKPRAKVKFLGTLRFASRACHHCVEQGRKDDMETWMYMMFDLFNKVKGLPWKKEPDRAMVVVRKEKFFEKAFFEQYYTENFELLKELWSIVDHINKCDYFTEPGYAMMEEKIMAVAKEKGIDLMAKMDWEGKKKEVEEKVEAPEAAAAEVKAPELKGSEEKPPELKGSEEKEKQEQEEHLEDKLEGEDDNGDDEEKPEKAGKKKAKA